MRILIDWLSREAKKTDIVKIMIIMLVIGVVYICSYSLLMYFDIVPKPTSENVGDLKAYYDEWGAVLFLFVILLVVFLEELFFRWFPYFIAVKSNDKFIWFMAVIWATVGFGRLHGASLGNVLAQGVMGIVFSVVFLKCGGMNKKFKKALFCSVLFHYMYNLVMFFGF